MQIRKSYMAAEGDQSAAGGGADTVAASGQDTVASGADTIAAASDTIAGGQDTVASGNDTVAAGNDTVAGNDSIAAVEWPEDWRQKAAAGDDKKLKRLERYASPQAALDALLAAQDRIRSGELKAPLKENATEDELKAWREENGIPESPDKYDLTLPDGLVIGEADKPIVDEFLKTAHGSNMSPAHVKDALGWYFAEVQRQEEQQYQADQEYKSASEEALREEFGADYKRNINMALALLDTAPNGLKDRFMGARLADGRPLMADADTFRFLTSMAREINPVSAVVPGSGENAMKAIDSELAELNKKMGDHDSDYWKGPNAVKNQQRWRELTDAQEKYKSRN